MLILCAILIPRLSIHYFMRACPWKASLGTLTGISVPSISTYFNLELGSFFARTFEGKNIPTLKD